MKNRKKIICLFLCTSLSFSLFSQSAEDSLKESESEQLEEETKSSKGGLAEIPPAKRPKPIDKEKAEAAAAKDESDADEENNRKTIKYGIPSEIGTLLDDLIKNEDPRFTEDIYDLFQVTRSSSIKEKILKYFTKLEDPCLEDYAVEILNDPYDERNEVVKAVFQYISAVKTKEAVPAVITLIESENENYFTDAIATLGDIGGPSEAMFLAEYLDRDDLTDAQRQNLMRTCGKMHAIETWDKLVDILENDDENTFVRMYAAESLGLMQVNKSVPILVRAYDASDPNLRQYVIKGLSNFPDVIEAKAVILQGVRDEHWKVRQESIKSVEEMKMTEAVPYLIYRASNDSEKVIKDASFTSIAKLNTQEGNDFLIKQLEDKKIGDNTKAKVVEVLLKEGHAGEKEVLELAEKTLEDDKRKTLRYAIGKELVKYYKPSFENVCCKFLQSKDATTVGIGLDLYKNGRYSQAEAYVLNIANEKKSSANKTRAQKLMKIEDEDNQDKNQPEKNTTEKNQPGDAK